MKNYGKGCTLIMVKWLDSRQPAPAWQHIKDVPEPSPVRCTSVGWVTYQDKFVMSLAPNLGDTESDGQLQVSGVIEIPIACILEAVTLVEEGA